MDLGSCDVVHTGRYAGFTIYICAAVHTGFHLSIISVFADFLNLDSTLQNPYNHILGEKLFLKALRSRE